MTVILRILELTSPLLLLDSSGSPEKKSQKEKKKPSTHLKRALNIQYTINLHKMHLMKDFNEKEQ